MGSGGVPSCHRLSVPDSAAAIAFYADVFGATETRRECLLDGHVLGAELRLGPYRLEVTETVDAAPDDAVLLTLRCDDPDAVLARAVAAGGTVERWGDTRPTAGISGVVRDPAGHRFALVGVETDATVPAHTRAVPA